MTRKKLKARPSDRTSQQPWPPPSPGSMSLPSPPPPSRAALPVRETDLPHEHQPLLDRARSGPLMTAKEVAEYLNTTDDRLYELEIPPTVALTPTPGQQKTRSLRWSAVAILAWLEERRPTHRDHAALMASREWVLSLRESGQLLSARQLARLLRVSTVRLSEFSIPHAVLPGRHQYPASVVAGWLHERLIASPSADVSSEVDVNG